VTDKTDPPAATPADTKRRRGDLPWQGLPAEAESEVVAPQRGKQPEGKRRPAGPPTTKPPTETKPAP
jgi:hypothetical protein